MKKHGENTEKTQKNTKKHGENAEKTQKNMEKQRKHGKKHGKYIENTEKHGENTAFCLSCTNTFINSLISCSPNH